MSYSQFIILIYLLYTFYIGRKTNMELLQLKYFCTAVQEGSINAAARKLRMTQPPVSIQIKLLEKELGCILLERGNRSLKLTDEGKILYERAVRVLSMTESAGVAVSDCHNSNSGTLRIGVVSSLSEMAANLWFKGFSETHANVNYELTEGTTYEMIDLLTNRVLDVVLIRTPFSARGLNCYSLAQKKMIVTGTEKFMTGFGREITVQQVSTLPLIMYRRWSGIIDREFAAKGYKPRLVCLADDARTCVSWAKAGLGAAVVPSDMKKSGLPRNLLTSEIIGIKPGAAPTIAVNEGGCDTKIGREFVQYFKSLG
jgi:DNA-binding transcriptional LysR family regulator